MGIPLNDILIGTSQLSYLHLLRNILSGLDYSCHQLCRHRNNLWIIKLSSWRIQKQNSKNQKSSILNPQCRQQGSGDFLFEIPISYPGTILSDRWQRSLRMTLKRFSSWFFLMTGTESGGGLYSTIFMPHSMNSCLGKSLSRQKIIVNLNDFKLCDY